MNNTARVFAVRPLTAAAAGLVLGVLAAGTGGRAAAAAAVVCGSAGLFFGGMTRKKCLAFFFFMLALGAVRALFPDAALPHGAANLFSALSQKAGSRIDALFPDFPGVARGMLLGQRNAAVDPALKERLYAVGVGHMLAVSGLHVSVLAGCITLVWRRGALKLRFFVLAAFLAGYALLTGCTPSVLRAAVMLLYATPLHEERLRRDSAVSFSLACILVLLWTPSSLTTPGFLLSFSAVAGILLLAGPAGGKLAFLPRTLRQGLSVSLAAVLGTLPVTVAYFGEFSAVGVLANLVILPLVPFFLIPAFLVTVASFAVPAVSCLAVVPRAMLWLIMTLAEAGGIPLMRLGAPGPFACVFWYAAMLFCSDYCRLEKGAKRKAAAAASVLAVVLWAAGR